MALSDQVREGGHEWIAPLVQDELSPAQPPGPRRRGRLNDCASEGTVYCAFAAVAPVQNRSPLSNRCPKSNRATSAARQ